MDLYIKNDYEKFFMNDVFDADEFFSSYSHANICGNSVTPMIQSAPTLSDILYTNWIIFLCSQVSEWVDAKSSGATE